MPGLRNLNQHLAYLTSEDRGITFINGSASERFVSYVDLLSRGKSALGYLQYKGLKAGDELIFQIEDNESFLVLFWACLQGGIIPVPINPAFTPETRTKLINVWNTLTNPYVITEEKAYSSFGPKIREDELKSYDASHMLRLDKVEKWSGGDGVLHEASITDTAFIQFSSGSTGSPKGVVLTHENLVININAIINCSGLTDEDATLGWMPLTHDLGLIGFHLTPLLLGINQYLIPTSAFIRRPSLWLGKINEHRVSFTASPNFGYKHFMSFFKEEVAEKWDLSCVKRILNGAEPISAELCDEFLENMQPYGLRKTAMFPVYGMAEASLAVAFPTPDEEFGRVKLNRDKLKIKDNVELDRSGVSFVCVGKPVDNCRIRICDDNYIPLKGGCVGHIEIKGGNVTKGYYNNPEANKAVFSSGNWLRTGDLGFFIQDKLYVTGRSKDIIFSNGQNLYPHDIERIAEEVDGVDLGKVVVCGSPNEKIYRDEILVFVLFKGKLTDFVDIALELKMHINRRLSIEVDAVLPVRSIEKTTSGKVKRFHYTLKYRNGEFLKNKEELHELILNKLKNRKRVPPETDLEKAIFKIWAEILKRDDIGIYENFFEVGGNSLKANMVIGKVARDLKVELSIREVFKSPTISSAASVIKDKKERSFSSIPSVSGRQFYPTTSVQQRLYVLNQLEPESLNYNITSVHQVKGKVDVPKLQACFDKLVVKHSILRTYFESQEGEPVQRVLPVLSIQVEEIDFTGNVDATVKSFIRPFDISTCPLLKVGISKVNDQTTILIFDIHHIIADGYSLNNLIAELALLYRGEEILPPKIRYVDFAVWQKDYLDSEALIEQRDYWLSQLGGELPSLSFPTDYPRSKKESKSGGCHLFKLDKSIYDGMFKLASDANSTFFTLLFTSLNIALSRYSGQEDIIIGTPITSRPHLELEDVFGPFINTLALRSKPVHGKTVQEFHQEVKEDLLNSFTYQNYPFEQLVDELNIQRDLSRNALFDVLFVLQNANEEKVNLEGVEVEEVNFFNGDVKFDLNIHVAEADQSFDVKIEYSKDLFDSATILQFGKHFENVIRAITKDFTSTIGDLDFLDQTEKTKLLEGPHSTEEENQQQDVLGLWDILISKFPENNAVCYQGSSLTYREIDQISNYYAMVLLEEGVTRGDFVGVSILTDQRLVCAMLAIWKVGAVFVPIDPSNPTERKNYIVSDSGIKAVFADESFASVKPIVLDISNRSEESVTIKKERNGESVAYAIYTSGTTGVPKGVLIPHRALTNYTQWINLEYGINHSSSSLLLTSYAFDLGYTALLGTLFNGGLIHLIEENDRKEPSFLVNYIVENDITFFKTTPSQLFTLLNATNTENFKEAKKLNKVFLGGESIKTEDVRTFLSINPNVSFINHYGPTESTIGCITHLIDDLDTFETRPVIGKPIRNTNIFILDRQFKPVPIGVEGQIFVSGHGLAVGYQGKSELYDQKFIDNPFKTGTKLYATGDVGRWTHQGAIEFKGRNDDQIKIRGYRVEIKGVESKLRQLENISDAVVIANKDNHNNDYLVAYVISPSDEKINYHQLLEDHLPQYMIPTYFVRIDEIPITANGKLDRSKLPDPELKTSVHKLEAVTDTEKTLVSIWQKVLGATNEIGTNENFFEIGGHSLKATLVISKIHKSLNVELPLREFFANPTIAQLAPVVEQHSTNPFEGIPTISAAEYYPVSSAQRRMFVLNKLDENATGYNMPGAFWVTGELDHKRLENAFLGLIQRHESLRTSFKLIDNQPVQVINESASFEIEQLQLKKAGTINSLIGEFVRSFDLSKVPLFRVGLYSESQTRHLLLFDIHHIISDGSSMGLIIRDFVKLYDNIELKPLRIQYKDYAHWHKGFSQSDITERQGKYWANQFLDSVPMLDLPTDFERPKMQLFNGSSFTFQFDKQLTSKLRKLSKEHNITMFMLLMGIYNIFLSKQTGQEDIVVGTPVAGRNHEDLQKIIGVFLNTLAIRSYPKGSKKVKDFLLEVKKTSLDAYENQDYPFDQLVESLELSRSLNRNPLFDTMLVVQNMELGELKTEDLRFEQYEFDLGSTQFDLSLIVFENEDTLDFTVDYSTNLFSRLTVERFVNRLIHVANQLPDAINSNIDEIQILSKEEESSLLNNFNDNAFDYDKLDNVLLKIERKVNQLQNQVAFIHDDKKFTYQEIWTASNVIANVLKEKGIGPGDVVPLILERGIFIPISILGVLKAGAAYVFVDPKYPLERIEFMLEDSSKSGAVITESKYERKVYTLPKQVFIDQLDLKQGPDSITLPELKPDALAYMIYTSGSTGKPKGVMISHNNLNSFVEWSNKEFESTDFDITYNSTSYSFDLSIFEMFFSLSAGKKIRILEDGLSIEQYLEEDQKILINTVPVVIKDLLTNGVNLQNVSAINMAGEPIPLFVKDRLEFGKVEVRNLYGPSEDTTYSTCYRFRDIDEHSKQIIGKPIGNTQAYVLNANGNLAAMGVAGELFLAGEGVTQGYLNRPSLTSRRYLNNPFTEGSGKMYRTGDLVRWLPNGDLEYLGRIDNQVKIRGYRIELGELEQKLYTHEEIKDVVVTDRVINESGDKLLCAYYVSEHGKPVYELRTYLSAMLPAYMVPNTFTHIESIPTTPNGKVDKGALPYPNIEGEIKELVTPESPTEIKLVELWQRVLGVIKVGLTSNFFDLGGHSLQAIRLVNEVNKSFGVNISIREIYEALNLEELAVYIDKLEKVVDSLVITPAENREEYPLSVAQHRIFVLEQFEGLGTSYNMPGALKLKGTLDVSKLENAINALLERHESLRTSFHLRGDDAVQIVHQREPIKLDLVQGATDNLAILYQDFVKTFNLEQGNLFEVRLVQISALEYCLFYNMHHIISDGISISILTDELIKLYEGVDLPAPRLQYKDFAVWQHAQFDNSNWQNQKDYWSQQFADIPEPLALPCDYPRPAQKNYNGALVQYTLTSEQFSDLKSLATKQNVTPYVILLSTFRLLLYKYTGQQDFVIGTPVSGRTNHQLQNMIGMFVNTLALRSNLDPETDVSEFLKETSRQVQSAVAHQDYPFEELVDVLDLPRDVSRHPLFDVMFSYQEMSEKKLTLGDLEIEPTTYDRSVSKFDLTLQVVNVGEQIKFSFVYSSSLFKPETIEKLRDRFNTILGLITSDSKAKIGELPLATPSERKTVQAFNKPIQDTLRSSETIVSWFDKVVLENPEHIALQFEDTKLTYSELNNRANYIATQIDTLDKKTNIQFVPIVMEKSLNAVVAIFGVLKSGRAFVPIDSDYPLARIEGIIDDLKAELIISTNVISQELDLSSKVTHTLAIDEVNNVANQATYQPAEISTNDFAYLIYTSGSTGKPKGVYLTHSNLVNYIDWFVTEFEITNSDSTTLLHSFGFDGSFTNLFGALLTGGTLHVISRSALLNPGLLLEYVEREQISHMKFTPSMFASLVNNEAFDHYHIPSLRMVMLGGENISCDEVEKFHVKYPETEFINHYGPTESTIGSIAERIDFSTWQEYKLEPAIGTPILNTTCYILDDYRNIVPDGVVGELYIGGRGVGLGYHNRDELSKERFVDNPFSKGETLYKTGDLARILSDGRIVFHGRKDEQVKIRGYRIELGEITTKLKDVTGIAEQQVLALKDRNGAYYLCQYYVSDVELDVTDTKKNLAKYLPDYMVPKFFIRLDQFPVTVGGKLDKKRLPEPDESDLGRQEYDAPNGKIEVALAEVWQEVLSVNKVSRNELFFDLGGDSIKAIQIASRMKNRGFQLTVQDVFNAPILSDLALLVDSLSIEISQEEVIGTAPLIPVQKNFFESYTGDKSHFNQSVILELKEELDINALRLVIEKLLQHHDILRAQFDSQKFEIQQYTEDLVCLETVDISEPNNWQSKITEHANELQRSFNLDSKLVPAFVHYRTKSGEFLLIIVHHLVVDGVSWRFLLEDLNAGYEQALKEEKVELPNKTNSFVDWAKGISEYSNSPQARFEQEYWLKSNSRWQSEHLNFLVENNDTTTLEKISVEYDKGTTLDLLTKTNKAYNTRINDLLLSALTKSISEVFGDSSEFISVMLESHGREEILQGIDISRTVGWFTSKYPVSLKLNQSEWQDIIIDVKEELIKVPNNGIGYGIINSLSKTEELELAYQPTPCIQFNYLGQFDDLGETNYLKRSKLNVGENSDPNHQDYPLHINGRVIEGKLSFDFSAFTNVISQNKLKSLASRYRQNLIDLVEYCISQKQVIRTPGDLDLSSMTFDQLTGLESKINGGIDKIYPLTPMQKGMLFVYLSDKQNDPYFEQTTISLNGDIDYAKINSVFNKIVARHEIIRANIVYDFLDEPHTVIHKERSKKVEFKDLSDLEENEQQLEIEKHLESERKLGFDLQQDLLMNLTLIKVSETNFELCWSHHHIIMDGWCLGILMSEFMYFYHATEFTPEINAPLPYGNYVKWLDTKNPYLASDYWSDLLDRYESKVDIPLLETGTDEDLVPAFDHHRFELDSATTQKLNDFAQSNQLTVFNVIQSAWGLVLQQVNNSDQAVFGSVVSGRSPEIEGVEDIVGLFINTIPVLVEKQTKFVEMAQEVQLQFNASNQYSYLPLNEIQSNSQFKNELIDHILVFENYPLDRQVDSFNADADGMRISEVKPHDEITNYNLTISIVPGEVTSLEFTYNSVVLNKRSIETMSLWLERVLNQVIKKPSIYVDEVSLLEDAEIDNILNQYNDTYLEIDTSQTLPGLFRTIVSKYGKERAVQVGDEFITYEELNKRSDAVASELIKHGVAKGERVGLHLSRDPNMIVAIMGVLKSGGVYVPIEPEFPLDRKTYILEDSTCKIVLSNDPVELGDISDVRCLEIGTLIKEGDYTAEIPEIVPQDQAYIIYTSGSTGLPKGVQVRHENVINLLAGLNQEIYQHQEGQLNITLVASYVFDASVKQIFAAICQGHTLHIISEELKQDPIKLIQYYSNYNIDVSDGTPSFLRLLANEMFEFPEDYKVQRYIIGGEALNRSVVEDLYRKNSTIKPKITNVYGPTECTVDSTAYLVPDDVGQLSSVMPIGKPLANQQVYVLNENNRPVPIGVRGELCIGGASVSSGYLNRPELNLEKFVQIEGLGLVYKTGDYVRWNNDGQLEFLGRSDFQVKIKGYRIEVGEVENVLLGNQAIQNGVVIDKVNEHGDKYLVAYYVSENEQDLEGLRRHMSETLPYYMIPSYFVALDEIPLNNSGKVNRRALPEPDLQELTEGHEIVEATTDQEKSLLKIWKEVLGVNSIGIDSNFFSLGGDSIKAILVASKLSQIGWRMEVTDLFNNPTIESLLPFLKPINSIAEQGIIVGEYSFTPIQKQFATLKMQEPHHFNQAVMLFSEEKMDVNQWKTVLSQIVEHHDVFRTVFDLESEIQTLHEQDSRSNENLFIIRDYEGLDDESIFAESTKIQSELSLKNGPLMASGLFNTEEGTHILIAVNHLIIDGVSWRILLEDFTTLLKGDKLPLKTDSFKSWSERLKEYSESDKLKSEQSYWESVESGIEPTWKGQKRTYGNIERVEINIDHEYTSKLLEEVNEAYNTNINDIFMVALSYSLEELTGKSLNPVFLEGHGREELFDGQDVTRTVGWFTSMYPVLLKNDVSQDLSGNIKTTKEMLRSVPKKGVGYGIIKYLSSFSDLDSEVEITFNYLGEFGQLDGARFTRSSINPGEAVSKNNNKSSVIDISGLVTDKILNLQVSYNTGLVNESVVKDFAEKFKSQLILLIDHCVKKEESEITVSDVGFNISADDFDNIF